MSFVMAYYIATFVALLITPETIFPVKGQCTVQGCDNGDPLVSIVAEIQQLRADLFDQLNQQVQSITELHASLQEIKSLPTTVNMSLQTVDRCPQEHDIYSRQFQSIHEILNQSFQEIKSLQATDRRRSQEHDIYMKQGQSIHELFNESFQEMKSQHGTVMTSLQAVDRRRSQEHDIYINQGQSIQELLNASFQEMKSQFDDVINSHNDTVMRSLHSVDRRSQEHDIDSKQFQITLKLLNESFQEMKSQNDVILRSQLAVDRRSQEHDIYIEQGQSIHKLLNESFQQTRSQHDAIMTSLQAVDRRLQEHDISIKNQNGNAWKLANGICVPTAEVCDCSDIKASGQIASGVYEVCAVHQGNRICTNAFCDMDTANGTSLVLQRRRDGSVNFYRTWAEYKEGFGDLKGEFWLGNEMLHLLTSKRNYKLRVDLEDFEGRKRYAEYTKFSISPSTDNYTLAIGGYSGSAGDSLSVHNGQQFSTKDVDNDKSNTSSCAQTFRGAWWYNSCYDSNLNGIYYRGNYSGSARQEEGIQWTTWYLWWYSLKSTEMKLVPVA